MLLIRKWSKAADNCPAQGCIVENLFCAVCFDWIVRLHYIKVTLEKKELTMCAASVDATG